MEEFMTKLDEYLVAAEQAVGEAAPVVWEATLFIIRMQGIVWLLYGFLWAGLTFLYWLIAYKKVWKWADNNKSKFTLQDDHIAIKIAAVVMGIITTGVCLTICLSYWSVNMLLSIFSPEAALVYRVGQTAGIF